MAAFAVRQMEIGLASFVAMLFGVTVSLTECQSPGLMKRPHRHLATMMLYLATAARAYDAAPLAPCH